MLRPKSKIREVFSANVWYTVRAHSMCGAERALKVQALPHSAGSLLARSHAKQGEMLFKSDTSEVEI
jgi:hypothetical protein